MALLCPRGMVIESRASGRSRKSRRPKGAVALQALPPSGFEDLGIVDLSEYVGVPPEDPEEESVPFRESIISLLLKLHSKLSNKPGSYCPNLDSSIPDSRIGDGPFFISKLLNKLCQNDETARQCVTETRARLYPKVEDEGSASSEEEAAVKAQEERKRKARERQRKIMAEFSQKQKYFMRNWDNLSSKEGGGGPSEAPSKAEPDLTSMDVEEETAEKFKAYDCVICNQSIPSTPERPVGMVILLQPTSVVGHQATAERISVPTSDLERIQLKQKRYTLGQYMADRADTLNRHFDVSARLLSMNVGWEGGIHVQTCGHHLHLDCHQSYLQSLRSHRIQNLLNVTKGEYHCPLCRQLANAVLPISPEIGELLALVKHSSSTEDLLDSIDRLLKDMSVPKFTEALTQAMARVMEHMTIATYPKYRSVSSIRSPASLFMFVCSILRSNLEIELIQRNGTLLYQKYDSKAEIKRSCLLPLLHVLSFHCKIVQGGEEPGGHSVAASPYWIRQIWASLTQKPAQGLETALNCCEHDIPMLINDPLTLLLQLIVLLPSRIDKDYLACIICNTYRLVIVRAAVSSLLSLTENQREQCACSGPLSPLLALAYSNLRDSSFFCDDKPSSEETFSNQQWSVNDVTCEVREMCLHFLRIASLLKSHILEECLPVIADPMAECGSLEQYLDVWDTYSVVNTAVMGKMCGSLDTWVYKDLNITGMSVSESSSSSSLASNSGVGDISSPVLTQLGTLAVVSKLWCSEVALFASQAQVACSNLLANVHFFRPKLLSLPSTYNAVFQYYHKKHCLECNSVPKEPLLCLMCGTLICMQEQCCEQQGVFEAVQHSINCGAGTAIYLYIQQSTIIVIRGPRVCIWGCVHLDIYGEEDKDLKRGKPLFLREDRYNLLEQQWLSHGLDHITGRRWNWHHNRF